MVGCRYFPLGPRLLSQPKRSPPLAGIKLCCFVTDSHGHYAMMPSHGTVTQCKTVITGVWRQFLRHPVTAESSWLCKTALWYWRDRSVSRPWMIELLWVVGQLTMTQCNQSRAVGHKVSRTVRRPPCRSDWLTDCRRPRSPSMSLADHQLRQEIVTQPPHTWRCRCEYDMSLVVDLASFH